MKKAIIGIVVVVFWFACVIAYSIVSAQASDSGQGFTVLTVKEDSVKDYNSMPVFKELADDTGIEVHWTYNTSAQYSNNVDPVSIKGIDAIYHAGFSNLTLYNYGKRGRIVAIDEYVDKCMPNFKKILDSRPDIKAALQSPDGKIYSLPRVEEMGLKAYPNILYLNKSWVEKLIDENSMPDNAKEITKGKLVDGLDLTRGQFKSILEKFRDKAYAGTKTVPLAFVSGNWQGNESDLIASFGVPENREHKTIVNGEVKFTVTDEKWFEAVQELSRWYQDKLINSSAYSQTDNEFLARGQDGRYGAFYWWEKDTVLAEENRDDYIIVKPLINDADGKRYVGVSNELEIEKGECVILSACADVEGLLSYFDKFFEPTYSAQLNYGSIKSGAFLSGKINGKLIPNDDHGDMSADDFRQKNAPYGVVYLDSNVWENSVEMESRAKLRLENLTKYVKDYTYEGATSIPNLNYTEDELKELNVYELSLSNNIASWFAKAVTGGSTPSKSSWEELIDTNSASIETVLRLNNEAYKRYLAAIQG